MALSVTQITDFRADIGDQTSPYAFTDDELDRLYTRADGSYNGAIILALEQLLANAVKFYNYTAGFTKAEQSDVFDHLEKLLERKQKKGNSLKMIGLSVVPPKDRDEPDA